MKNKNIEELASFVDGLIVSDSKIYIAEDVPESVLVHTSCLTKLSNAVAESLSQIEVHQNPSITIELLFTEESAVLNFIIADPDIFLFQMPFNIPEPIATSSNKQQTHVLVAEDDAMNQRLITIYIEQKGYRVTMVGNGLEAVEYLERHADTVDIVLMDMNMPVMDGQQAVDAIRSSDTLAVKTMPVLALTGHGHEVAARLKGMDGFILKPIDRAILYASINEALKQRD